MTTSTTTYDLVLNGGTLLDPAQGINNRRDIAFQYMQVGSADGGMGQPYDGIRRFFDVGTGLVLPASLPHSFVDKRFHWSGTPVGGPKRGRLPP